MALCRHLGRCPYRHVWAFCTRDIWTCIGSLRSGALHQVINQVGAVLVAGDCCPVPAAVRLTGAYNGGIMRGK